MYKTFNYTKLCNQHLTFTPKSVSGYDRSFFYSPAAVTNGPYSLLKVQPPFVQVTATRLKSKTQEYRTNIQFSSSQKIVLYNKNFVKKYLPNFI